MSHGNRWHDPYPHQTWWHDPYPHADNNTDVPVVPTGARIQNAAFMLEQRRLQELSGRLVETRLGMGEQPEPLPPPGGEDDYPDVSTQEALRMSRSDLAYMVLRQRNTLTTSARLIAELFRQMQEHAQTVQAQGQQIILMQNQLEALHTQLQDHQMRLRRIEEEGP